MRRINVHGAVMKSSSISSFFLVVSLVFLSACGSDKITVENLQNPNQEDEVITDVPVQTDSTDIFIVDATGKKWEIGHAVRQYGFEPGKFQFGLGPNAIPPILEPIMIWPGQLGYPDNGSTFLVLGISLEEDARAYSIERLSFSEVADEKFGDVHVAVAY